MQELVEGPWCLESPRCKNGGNCSRETGLFQGLQNVRSVHMCIFSHSPEHTSPSSSARKLSALTAARELNHDESFPQTDCMGLGNIFFIHTVDVLECHRPLRTDLKSVALRTLLV